ncbi:ADP-ribosyltransferase [Corynebacterium sp. DNF00584]|uniref:VG15 protein n=1 Tax=Corynebacterium sp. DNF00584 TaxID=1384076 RepID=UPI0007923850|nr:ADP-ribosyltransferase [Corynebacterium sp. DNF00584]KXB52737.1 hypothetical protein HMPREF0307_02055 [Corynebacterium sp. DNF00584]
MGAEEIRAAARKLDARVAKLVAAHLVEHGVPQSASAVADMAQELYPTVAAARTAMYRRQVQDMGAAAAAQGLEVSPAKEDAYDVHSLYQALTDVVGLTPESTALVEVEFLDPDTQKMVARRVAVQQADPHDVRVVEEVVGRVGARVGRHVRAGGRRAVANTAMAGKARVKSSKKPVKMGYARVLSGAENCAFCAMLASRGPVYSEDTVTRRRDGHRYHDHCDCQGVLVFKGYSWEGEDEYRKLEAAWRESDKGDGSAATLARFNQKIAETPGGVQAVIDGVVPPKPPVPPRASGGSGDGGGRPVSLLEMGRTKAADYLYDRYGVREPDFTEPELGALWAYTDVGHREMNELAREYKSQDMFAAIDRLPRKRRRELQPVAEAMRDVDSAMERAARIKEPVEVVRRIKRQELAGSAMSGYFDVEDVSSWGKQEFKAWGYLSTSTHGQDEFGGIELRLAVPSGTKAVYVGWNGAHDKSSSISQHPDEEELLLGRQTRYRINQVEEIKGQLVLHAEVIGQDV